MRHFTLKSWQQDYARSTLPVRRGSIPLGDIQSNSLYRGPALPLGHIMPPLTLSGAAGYFYTQCAGGNPCSVHLWVIYANNDKQKYFYSHLLFFNSKESSSSWLLYFMGLYCLINLHESHNFKENRGHSWTELKAVEWQHFLTFYYLPKIWILTRRTTT